HQVRDNHVGGILWFLLSDVSETARLNRRLQSLATEPLLIAADLEAGVGMRFLDTTNWPWPMALAATGDPSLAERQGRVVAEEARAIGVNQIYAPVADVNVDPANPVINVRSYGEDPENVAQFVSAFVRGAQSGGVLATAKHFPGHGATRTDSHRALPVLSADRARLDRVELVPFRAAIAAGVGAIMTAHLSLPAIDATPAPARTLAPGENPYTDDLAEVARDATVPASMSGAVLEGLLRGDLGFRGLVVTDALDMGGIVDHFDPGEAAVRAILAGADQVIKSPDTDAAIAGVRRAVAEGRISVERLERSVARILEAKRRFPAPIPDLEAAFRVVDGPEHRALAEEIARRAVTLVREAPGALPLARPMRIVHVVVNDVATATAPGAELGRALSTRLSAPPETFVLDPRSRPEEIEPIRNAALQADAVLVSLFVRVRTGTGKLVVPDGARSAVESLSAAGAKLIGVSFGDPYLAADLPGLATYVAAYGDQPVMQAATARALFGETEISGRLPVTIPGVAQRGAGVTKERMP
ncbi:MAG TPA: glycoside hydrolase family 3 N-terminal domain-containing protein, partial [Thermoanaerobaculia bacterium]|nr:glycoside hydrolase family 3 N-terminal domain-containing protein [Thermoanaerobaculia bacterium]